MKKKKNLAERLAALPAEPGVYLFRDEKGDVIYVGKAVSLRNRVRAYFQENRPADPKTSLLTAEIASFDFFTTRGEAEAFFLESRLVKHFQPRYNIDLRDDKTFPFVRLTREEYPRVAIVREKRRPDALYYGPFTDVKALRRSLRKLREIFPVAACGRAFTAGRANSRPCLDHGLGRCLAPCAGRADPAEYRRVARALSAFFRGRGRGIIRELEAAMRRAAGELRFEEAARLRDEIAALKAVRRHPRSLGAERPDRRERISLRDRLELKREPVRIEGYDISTLFGRQAVGAMVVFLGGAPSRESYRRFRISAVGSMDDYAMLAEVLGRRAAETGWPKPDLVLVDGGRGQVETASRALAAGGLKVPLVGLAKEEERFFRPGDSRPLGIAPDSPEGLFLRRIRDEAHRFAIAYHRRLRGRDLTASALDRVPGIGPARRRRLMETFGSVAAIAAAPETRLREAGIPAPVAGRLKEILAPAPETRE